VTADEELLTVEEVAERLGVSVATVRRRCATGALPARKAGRSWLIHGSSLPARAPRRHSRRPRAASSQVEFQRALKHLRTHDLPHDVWVPDVLRFEDDLANPDRLASAAAARLDLEEPFDPPSYVPVPKSPVFPRNAVDLSLVDRLAYQAVVEECAPLVEVQLSESVYSARLSQKPSYFLKNGRNSWLRWKNDVVAAVRSDGPWMAETDITAFFDFVKHELLLPDLLDRGLSSTLVAALREMLRTWAFTPNTGLPQGPNASRVLGNFYLVPVDSAMTAIRGVRYFRYMDDIRLVGPSRAAVISALQVLDAECRRRGLALSTRKTALHVGDAAVVELEDETLDQLQYAFDAGDDDDGQLRHDLRNLFRSSLKGDQIADTRRARFSLGRLYRLRDREVLTLVLKRLEVLAPLRDIAPKYLHPFLKRRSVQRRLTNFLQDPERNTSPFLSAWLFAAMADLAPPLPEAWIDHARLIALNRAEPPYHRSVAISVLALGLRMRDLTHLEDIVKYEHDPEIVRAAVVALKRVSHLSKSIEARARRINGITGTLDYLRGCNDLPSMIFGSRRIPIRSVSK
jgi:excisionase family DNA binding protein